MYAKLEQNVACEKGKWTSFGSCRDEDG